MEVKTIFAIEDEEDILEIYDSLLNQAGYKVFTTLTGENVLEQISEYHPDLILLDVRLGRWNGGEICKQIKLNPETRHISVLLISGEVNIQETMVRSGADGFLPKPFDIAELLNRVEQLLSA